MGRHSKGTGELRDGVTDRRGEIRAPKQEAWRKRAAELCPAERFRAIGRWLRLPLSTSHCREGEKRGPSSQHLVWMPCLRPGSHIREPSRWSALDPSTGSSPAGPHPQSGYGRDRGQGRGFQRMPSDHVGARSLNRAEKENI